MSFRDDERGQAIQVGAVLLFAALIIAFSSYQAFVVPNQNRQVEFNHNQQVQGQLQEVRNAIVSVPGGNTGRSVTVDLGVEYPSRLVALNPGPATGTLRTSGTTDERYNLSIANATATGEVGDFWNGSTHVYNTGGLVYAPGYNRYDQAPQTAYENSILINENRDRSVPITGQQLIEGDRITLVTLNGSLSSTRSGTISADLQALSTSTRTVSVRNDSHNLTLEVPTRLSEDRWENLTDGEDNVEGVEVSEGALDGEWGLLRLDLASDTTYDLRMAKVGVGTGTEGTDGKYLTAVSGDGERIGTNEDQRLEAEVRDGFNNPVSGEEVNASVVSGDGTVESIDNVTDSDGRAVFRYEAPGSATNAEIEVNISASATEREQAVFAIDVTAGGGNDGSGPATNALIADPSSVVKGEAVTLNATISDFGLGGSDVYDVEWWSDLTPPNGGPGSGEPMTAVDGAFDQVEENVTTEVNTGSWETGTHTISVRGRDGNGNWGPVSNVSVMVTEPTGIVFTGGEAVDSPTDANGLESAVQFEVTNYDETGAEITAITVEATGGATEIQEADPDNNGPYEYEVYVSASDEGWAEAGTGGFFTVLGYDLGTEIDLDNTATVASNEGTAEVTLYEFLDGAEDPVDMAGEEITITLSFNNRPDEQFTFTG